MEHSGTIDTQVILPTLLYRTIQQRAQERGCSVSSEIVAILTDSLEMERLAQEAAAWEAASDEDWLAMEAMLVAEER